MSKPTPTHQNPHSIHRLPCRGYEESCVNYQYCDGKLWRMEQEPKVKVLITSSLDA